MNPPTRESKTVHSPTVWLACILVQILVAVDASSIFIPDLPNAHYKVLGDINLGVLIPIRNHGPKDFCDGDIRNLGLLQRMEAIAYAVHEINQRGDLLGGYTLGFVMFDDCFKDITALAQALHFIENVPEGECAVNTPDYCTNGSVHSFDVFGVVGSESSITTTQVANLLTSFKIPLVSYYASGPALANRNRYPNFFRTIPSDEKQTQALVDLLQHFNWSYIAIFYSAGDYGAEAYRHLKRKVDQAKLCFSHVIEIMPSTKGFLLKRLVYRIILDPKVNVVIVYAPLSEAQEILKMAQLLKIGDITWIASDGWAQDTSDIEGIHVAHGALSFSIDSSPVGRFDSYFGTIGPHDRLDNPWIHEFWEKYFNCTPIASRVSEVLPACKASSRFTKHPLYVPDRSVSLVYDAVYTFAHGLHRTFESYECSRRTGTSKLQCVKEHLPSHIRNLSFPGETQQISFSRNGDVRRNYIIENIQKYGSRYVFQTVGEWSMTTSKLSIREDLIKWTTGDEPVKSFCSLPCKLGEGRVWPQKPCCWFCERCNDDQYTERKWGWERCQKCSNDTFWPDESRTHCVPVIPIYLQWHDVLGVVLISLAATGLVACFLTMLLFARNNTDPLIKASSRELSYILLGGLITSYALVFCFLLKPSDYVCLVRLIGISLCFTIMYAPLLTKTIRIYRIFKAGHRMNRSPTCVSSKSQIGIAATLVLVHVCIVVVWSFSQSPTVGISKTAPNILELTCHFPMGPFVGSIVYNSLLILSCVYFAFKTRKLPDNFNESRFISFSVYSTIVIELAFIPAYFAVEKAFYEVMFLSLLVISTATLMLVCIFLPKIYALYFVDNKDELHVSPKFMNKGGSRRLVQDENSEAHISYGNLKMAAQSSKPADDLPSTKSSPVLTELFTAGSPSCSSDDSKPVTQTGNDELPTRKTLPALKRQTSLPEETLSTKSQEDKSSNGGIYFEVTPATQSNVIDRWI